MTIKVLGSGCATCKKLFERATQAVGELGLGIEVEYITDVQRIIDLGFMRSPVLTIDNKPIIVGTVPKVEKIKQAIKDNI